MKNLKILNLYNQGDLGLRNFLSKAVFGLAEKQVYIGECDIFYTCKYIILDSSSCSYTSIACTFSE